MRYLLPIAFSLAAVAAHAHGSCQPVLAAMQRHFDIPSHMIVTKKIGANSAEQGETINTRMQQERSPENAHASMWKLPREKPDSGELCVVYPVANKNAAAGEYVISRRSGLPLKQAVPVGAGGHLCAARATRRTWCAAATAPTKNTKQARSRGRSALIVASRFSVDVSGEGVPMSALEQANGEINLAGLEGMKDHGAQH